MNSEKADPVAVAMMTALTMTVRELEANSAFVFLSMFEVYAQSQKNNLPQSQQTKIDEWLRSLRQSVGHG